MKQVWSALALAAGALSLDASAATIDFEAYPNGSIGSNVLVTPTATVTGHGDELYNLSDFYGMGDGGSICALSVGTCESDMDIDFASVVTNLTFSTFGYDDGDVVEISAFNGATLAGSLTVVGDQVVDFSALGPLTRLTFDDASTGAGYAYGAFSFDVAAVPEPGTWALMFGGLAAVGAIARRRAAR